MIDMTRFNGSKAVGRDYSSALADILPELILKQSLSIRDIAEKTGRAESTVTRYIKRHQGKGIHIARWKRRANKIVACYRIGTEQDAPKPRPLNNKEICRRYKERHKDILNEKQAVKRLGVRLIDKRLKKDTLMSALFS